MNATEQLRKLGQSVWVDYLDHDLVESGELARLIAEDGVGGMTSNPTIFQKAIASSKDYDRLITRAAAEVSNARIFEDIEVGDVSLACDAFGGLFKESGGSDGFVSIEVSPRLARETDKTIQEAHRLAARVKRPNLMVKIPGTREGLPAIEQCLTDGVNINITLLFSVERYGEVVDAYFNALERRLRAGQAIDRIASVASFFVSRVDTKVDAAIDRMIEAGGAKGERARAVRGKTAIANAKLAYDTYRQLYEGPRWAKLASAGAHPQRVLWASTSTKDPTFSSLYYAEALIGRGTVDTMTLETLRAYLAGGKPEPRLEDPTHVLKFIDDLSTIGINIGDVTDELEDEGIAKFAKSYDEALDVIARRRKASKAA